MIAHILTYVALRSDRRAVTALEYGLIAGAVVAIGLASFSVIGTELSDKFSAIADELT